MATATRAKRDRLDPNELLDRVEPGRGPKTVYEAGLPYLWTLSHGWAIVGFYCGHVSPTSIRVAHANHFRNAGKDYGRLAMEGPGPNCEWRYEGEIEINPIHLLKVQEYHGEVPRGRVRV